MKIIIAGVGEVGGHLAKMFSAEKHEIVILDDNVQKLDSLNAHYDLMTFEGNATFIKDLKEAGVEDADLFVAVTSHESVNLTSCMLAAKLGAKKTLARVDNREYVQGDNTEIFKNLGIDTLIYPEMLAACEIVEALKTSWQRINMSFCKGALVMLGIKLRSNAQILNKAFKTGFLDHARFRIVAIKRNMDTFIPRGEDNLMAGDIAFIITTQENMEFTREQAGKVNRPIRNVMIMGGSRIGINTARMLPEKTFAKIIEKNHERSVVVSEEVPDRLVINGDGRNLELLEEEGIGDMDAFVAVTGSSETNILACLAAKRYGIVKTIAEIENTDYIPLAQSLDIGTIINKKLIAASHIYQRTLDESVQNVKSLPSSEAQVIEFIAQEGSRVTRHRLRDLHIPVEANFGGYVRGHEGFVCSGDTEIKQGDHVIVFCFASVVRKVEALFN